MSNTLIPRHLIVRHLYARCKIKSAAVMRIKWHHFEHLLLGEMTEGIRAALATFAPTAAACQPTSQAVQFRLRPKSTKLRLDANNMLVLLQVPRSNMSPELSTYNMFPCWLMFPICPTRLASPTRTAANKLSCSKTWPTQEIKDWRCLGLHPSCPRL